MKLADAGSMSTSVCLVSGVKGFTMLEVIRF